MCYPLPGKVIKLSFSTSPKTLSPGFDLALVYREAVFSNKSKAREGMNTGSSLAGKKMEASLQTGKKKPVNVFDKFLKAESGLTHVYRI